MSALRIVIADDQSMIRSGLALVLGAESDLLVVAQCADGATAVDACARLHPDLVLMDVRMPGVDGPTATAQLRAAEGAPPVLTLTTFDDDEVLWAAIDSGAAGFVLKDAPAETLIEAVRAVAAGGSWLDPRVLPRVLARARSGRRVLRPAGLDELTPRETDVLRLMCRGAPNGDIAARLHLGERTVKSHVSAILQKLGVRDRTAAVVAAFDAGGV